MKYILTVFLHLLFFASYAQIDTSKNTVENDSLLSKHLIGMPIESQKILIDIYKKMDVQGRKEYLELLDFFSSMPKSSKKNLIQNIDTNYVNILSLKTFVTNLVPADFAIYIEFQPADTMMKIDENIDLWVSHPDNISKNPTWVFQEWNIELKSSKLDSLLSLTPLKRKDLLELKKYLDKANCISVSNRKEFEIGYSRSGMGKYSYLIFDKPLTKDEQLKYNNGCEFIFYKDNIVLEYGGGAIGPQCFPDRD